MDSIPTWVSLQNRTLAGGGWSKLRPQTPAEEKEAVKRRKAMLQEILTKEQSHHKEGPPTDSIRIEQLMQGRLSTPTSNDIIKRNEVCHALLATPLQSINHLVRESENFGKGPTSNTLMDIILEFMFGWHLI